MKHRHSGGWCQGRKVMNGFLTMGGLDVDMGVLDIGVEGVLTIGSPCKSETLGVNPQRVDGIPTPDMVW